MLFWLVFGSVVGALVVGLSMQSSSGLGEFSMAGVSDNDLPCPWCHAQTTEDDRACPSCGQRFG